MRSNSGRMLFNRKLAGSWPLVVTLLTLLATACSSERALSEEHGSDGSGVARLRRKLDACPGPRVTWSDEFIRTGLDNTMWSLCKDGSPVAECGKGNNEQQTYRSENLDFSAGTLKIEAREENGGYTSGKIHSLGKANFTYGRFEARIKLPIGQGIRSVFRMMPSYEINGPWPKSGEIDIMENIGSEPSTVHGTLHFGEPWPDNNQTGGSYSLPDGQRFTDDFHEFAIEKELGVMRWIVDGVLFSFKKPYHTYPSNWAFDAPERYHFALSLAVGGDWPGDPDATTIFPQTLEVDYVRVYDGPRPYLTGDSQVDYSKNGVFYSVGNAHPDTTFTWTVPVGATFDWGPSTHSITVNWGSASGTVAVTATPNCDGEELTMHVTVDPQCTGSVDCDDGNLCNGVESCSIAGLCVAGIAIDCDDSNPCTADSCYPMTGICSYNDITCDDSNACTVDSCDPITGCSHDTITCDDTNACTADSCDPMTGCSHDDITCDDGLLCSADSCDKDIGCVHDTITCDDGLLCSDDSCDTTTGFCINDMSNCPGPCFNKGASCNSNNECCSLKCKHGSCKGGI
jgi:beta-glucanase (GH16 family)